MLDFPATVDQRGKPIADIEQGHVSTASCLLAMAAMKLGRPLSYDPQKREVADDAETNRLVRRAYRAPWKHPGMA